MREPDPLKPVLVGLAVLVVFAGLVIGLALWADAVDFMQANTNAGCCGG